MSYILDALRRADAERERGTVPSLHTQQFGTVPEDDEAPPRPRLLIGTIVLLVLALCGVLAWTFLGGSEPANPPTQVVTPAPAPVPLPAPPPVAMAPAAAAAPAAVPPPVMTPPAASPGVSPAPRTAAAPKPAPARPAQRPQRREAAASAAPSTAPAADERIYSFNDLPDAIRRELPKISYGGGSYSPDRASRLAFLNGQVFHEGDTIAPGLVLRQVKQKGAVLAYKGYRFEIGP